MVTEARACGGHEPNRESAGRVEAQQPVAEDKISALHNADFILPQTSCLATTSPLVPAIDEGDNGCNFDHPYVIIPCRPERRDYAKPAQFCQRDATRGPWPDCVTDDFTAGRVVNG